MVVTAAWETESTTSDIHLDLAEAFYIYNPHLKDIYKAILQYLPWMCI